MVILLLGSNDLTAYLGVSPVRIANQLVELGYKFLQLGVKRVAFCQCIPRFGWLAFKHMCTLDESDDIWTIEELEKEFNDRATEFNSTLEARHKEDGRFDYIAMRGLRENIVQKLKDGLHLGVEGQDTLMHTLRREIVYNCHKARGGRSGNGRSKKKKSKKNRERNWKWIGRHYGYQGRHYRGRHQRF